MRILTKRNVLNVINKKNEFQFKVAHFLNLLKITDNALGIFTSIFTQTIKNKNSIRFSSTLMKKFVDRTKNFKFIDNKFERTLQNMLIRFLHDFSFHFNVRKKKKCTHFK